MEKGISSTNFLSSKSGNEMFIACNDHIKKLELLSIDLKSLSSSAEEIIYYFQINLDSSAYFIQTTQKLLIGLLSEMEDPQSLHSLINFKLSKYDVMCRWSNYLSYYLGVKVNSHFYIFDASKFKCLNDIYFKDFKHFTFGPKKSPDDIWSRFAAIFCLQDDQLVLVQPVLPPNFPFENDDPVFSIDSSLKTIRQNSQLAFYPRKFPLVFPPHDSYTRPIIFNVEWTPSYLIISYNDGSLNMFKIKSIPHLLEEPHEIGLELLRTFSSSSIVHLVPQSNSLFAYSQTVAFSISENLHFHFIGFNNNLQKHIVAVCDQAAFLDDGQIICAEKPEAPNLALKKIKLALLKEQITKMNSDMEKKATQLKQREVNLALRARKILSLTEQLPSKKDMEMNVLYLQNLVNNLHHRLNELQKNKSF